MNNENKKLRDLTVSAVGMGCMAFSPAMVKSRQKNTVSRLSETGTTMAVPSLIQRKFTAPGLSGVGHNERIVGKALADVRGNVVIGTKLFLDRGRGSSGMVLYMGR